MRTGKSSTDFQTRPDLVWREYALGEDCVEQWFVRSFRFPFSRTPVAIFIRTLSLHSEGTHRRIRLRVTIF